MVHLTLKSSGWSIAERSFHICGTRGRMNFEKEWDR